MSRRSTQDTSSAVHCGSSGKEWQWQRVVEDWRLAGALVGLWQLSANQRGSCRLGLESLSLSHCDSCSHWRCEAGCDPRARSLRLLPPWLSSLPRLPWMLVSLAGMGMLPRLDAETTAAARPGLRTRSSHGDAARAIDAGTRVAPLLVRLHVLGTIAVRWYVARCTAITAPSRPFGCWPQSSSVAQVQPRTFFECEDKASAESVSLFVLTGGVAASARLASLLESTTLRVPCFRLDADRVLRRAASGNLEQSTFSRETSIQAATTRAQN